MFTLPIRISKLPSSNLLVSIVFKYFGDVFTGSEMVITANHTSRTFFKRLNFVFEMKRIFLLNRHFYHILHPRKRALRSWSSSSFWHFVLLTTLCLSQRATIRNPDRACRARFLFSFFEEAYWHGRGRPKSTWRGRDRHGTTLFKEKLSKFL